VGADVQQRTVFGQSCFYKAFLTKNLEFMNLCVLAGFNLYKNEPWIKEYLKNPDFIDYTDYYVKRATDNSLANDLVNSELRNKTDQEISELIYLDEYLSDRFYASAKKKETKESMRSSEVSKAIYTFIKRAYTNPLSLKEVTILI